MTASISREPVNIELEFVRTKEADDAFAFRFTRQTYLVRGRQGAYETAELPWSRELLSDLDDVRRPDRDPATVARVGATLREFLDTAGWSGHESALVRARAERRRVHLTIRSAAAELYALPWELLTLRADGQHLGALDHVLLRYAWPGTSTIEADAADERPRRVLVAWSAAGGAIPAADQVSAIQASADATARDVQVVANASYGSIADALEAGASAGRPFTVLHLLCHGAEAGSTFGLSLDAEDEGRPVVVDAGRLQQLLAPHAHALRLVVVAACDGGNMGEPGNRIGSVAQRLHRTGLRYVIASRYPLSARGSTRMTAALYRSLWSGEPVERAFIEARAAASREVRQLDWASLQLYARPEDGEHGAVLSASAPSPAPAPAIERAAEPSAARAPQKRRWVIMAGALVAGLIAALVALYGSDDDEVSTTPEIVRAPVDATGPTNGTAPTTTPADGDAIPSPTGPRGDSTSMVAGSGEDSTTGVPVVDPTKRQTTPTRRPNRTSRTATSSSSAPSPQRTKRCGAAVKETINDGLKRPKSGIYRIKVEIRSSGGVRLKSCPDCSASVEDDLKTRLGRLKLDTRGDELPCTLSFDWK